MYGWLCLPYLFKDCMNDLQYFLLIILSYLNTYRVIGEYVV